MKRDFSLKWKFLFDLLLLKLNLLYDGNLNIVNIDMKMKDTKYFTLLLFIFYPSKMVLIHKILCLHKWDLFYMVFYSFPFL